MSENTARYRVTGMTCDQCVVAVTEEVRRLEGVSDAPLLAGAVRDAIDEAGYALAS